MAKVYLIAKTGITGGNYKWWESKEACDKWFLGKAKGEAIDKVSFIRPDSTTKSAYNAACVHIPLAYKECIECDYIAFNNDAEGGRLFLAQIIGREYVNEKSTRLYFAVDYVATYWDTIKVGKSFVERTHVGDDWEGGFTASKYLLPEPVPVVSFYRPETLNANPFDDTNTEMIIGSAQYNLITSVDINGAINKPTITLQTGGSVTGNLYSSADRADVEQWLGKIVSYTARLINRGDTVTQYAQNIFVCPETVVFQTPNPIITTVNIGWASVFNLGAMYKPRHAKVYDYLRLRIYSNASGADFAPEDLRGGGLAQVKKTGGIAGNYSAAILGGSGGEVLTFVDTQTWPAIGFSATVEAKSYQFNEKITNAIASEWDAKEARKAEYNRRHGS